MCNLIIVVVVFVLVMYILQAGINADNRKIAEKENKKNEENSILRAKRDGNIDAYNNTLKNFFGCGHPLGNSSNTYDGTYQLLMGIVSEIKTYNNQLSYDLQISDRRIAKFETNK